MLLIPLVLTGALTQASARRSASGARAMREATDDVTGFIGETFGAVQAIKLFRAEKPILERFANLNRIRHRAALADTFLTEVLRGINRNMSTISIAFVLLFAAGAIQRGEISLGELTVFLTYLPRLTDYMAFVGDIIAQHRRTGVAFERIQALAVDAPFEALLDRTRVPADRAITRRSRTRFRKASPSSI